MDSIMKINKCHFNRCKSVLDNIDNIINAYDTLGTDNLYDILYEKKIQFITYFNDYEREVCGSMINIKNSSNMVLEYRTMIEKDLNCKNDLNLNMLIDILNTIIDDLNDFTTIKELSDFIFNKVLAIEANRIIKSLNIKKMK
jgi:hypothetical protein